MTGVSLLLIVVAVVLLGYGLLDASNTYLVASILTSLLAAIALGIGSRRSGRAAVARAVAAEEAARNRRRVRQDDLVGAGVGSRSGGGTDRSGPAGDGYTDEEYTDEEYTDDDLVPAAHETALLDVGRRGVPSQPDAGDGRDARWESAPAGARYDEAYGAGDAYGADDDGYADDDVDEDDPEDEPAAQLVDPSVAAHVAQLDDDVLVIDGRPRYHLAGCVHLLGREHEPLPAREAAELGFTPCGLCEPDSALLARVRRV